MSSSAKRKPEKRRPDLETVFSINADGSHNHIHPADVSGPWQVRKNIIYAVLIIVYLVLPWIQINGNPMICVDLAGRVAYLFGGAFTNQDVYLLFFIVSGFGFALFVLTSLWGRVWCGFGCPQTVFMEGVFRRVERWVEGPRNRRIRRNAGPLTFDKVWRKAFKHAVFLAISLVLTHTFLAYFIPARELVDIIPSGAGDHMSAFLWTMFWTAVIYFDFAWFREQTCLILCPYGRLQSTLIDDATIIIGYDEKRGEPRVKHRSQGGDCVDCHRCVHVCPTGIDIRNGLQMECIGCADCIDACDDVMRKVGKPTGLVRYDSRMRFDTGKQTFLRPRVYVYAAAGLLGLTVFAFTAGGRTSFQANMLRSSGVPFVIDDGKIRNLYTLHLQNKTTESRTYRVGDGATPEGGGPSVEFIIPHREIALEGMKDVEVPIFAIVSREDYNGAFELVFPVSDTESGTTCEVQVRFRGP